MERWRGKVKVEPVSITGAKGSGFQFSYYASRKISRELKYNFARYIYMKVLTVITKWAIGITIIGSENKKIELDKTNKDYQFL
jgi:hypothetical protein